MRTGIMILTAIVSFSIGCSGTVGPGHDDSGPATMEDANTSPSTGFSVEPLSDGDLASIFSKQIFVFGVQIVATEHTDDDKVVHAATIMAEYLDNDEDSAPDDQRVVDAMLANKALLVMFETDQEAENSGIFESDFIDEYWGQDLYGDETNPDHRFDASLEEVLHLIHTAGYATVWRDALSPENGTLLSEALDVARGGHFNGVPNSYPESAWFHYDDHTCDYECQGVEYFYWGLTSWLGAQADRCDEIAHEWEPCTPTLLEEIDIAMHQLVTDVQYTLPTEIPNGDYAANAKSTRAR